MRDGRLPSWSCAQLCPHSLLVRGPCEQQLQNMMDFSDATASFPLAHTNCSLLSPPINKSVNSSLTPQTLSASSFCPEPLTLAIHTTVLTRCNPRTLSATSAPDAVVWPGIPDGPPAHGLPLNFRIRAYNCFLNGSTVDEERFPERVTSWKCSGKKGWVQAATRAA